MAPMTGRVPNTQQNRFVFSARFPERLFTPRVPIDGIVRVLKQVRTGFLYERVGVLVFGVAHLLLEMR